MKCIPCPVPPGIPCHSGSLSALCEWARSGDAVKLRHVVNRSAIAAGLPPTGEAIPCPETRMPVSESNRLVRLARECPHRKAPQCSCEGLATCLLGKGRSGTVALSECLQCVANDT
jgi:hypothetical protein